MLLRLRAAALGYGPMICVDLPRDINKHKLLDISQKFVPIASRKC